MSSVSSDDGCSDWASDFGDALQTKSLFDSEQLPSPEAAIQYDHEKHGFNLKERKLDMYGRVRLINCIRKRGLSGQEANDLSEADFADESLYAPVIADDPLLQYDFEDGDVADDEPAVELQLEQARQAIARLQSMVDIEDPPVKRDDDTHYFDSYAGNDIHEVMLKDTTRTVSYGRYIQQAVKGKVVMDVGCGTGILSMMASRAGAEHVYAIEASGLAKKAEENVKRNGCTNITVIQSKVEELQLDVKVDIIISEWMGYMLLYESMLDSVLWARDRFLKEGGFMAPSHTRLVISGITGDGHWKEQVGFWDDVYGFDMTAMAGVYFGEGIVETVDDREIMTDDATLKEIDSLVATPKDLDFETSFKLTAAADGEMRAFLTHFDTFFVQGQPGAVDTTRVGDAYVVEPYEGEVSFTTGPRGKDTHWKQVSFLLKKPLMLKKGDVVEGKFYCRKADSNSRELDVEIHLNGEWLLYKVR